MANVIVWRIKGTDHFAQTSTHLPNTTQTTRMIDLVAGTSHGRSLFPPMHHFGWRTLKYVYVGNKTEKNPLCNLKGVKEKICAFVNKWTDYYFEAVEGAGVVICKGLLPILAQKNRQIWGISIRNGRVVEKTVTKNKYLWYSLLAFPLTTVTLIIRAFYYNS